MLLRRRVPVAFVALAAVTALCWWSTGSEPYPEAFGPSTGLWASLVSGDRGAWLLLAPGLLLAAFLLIRRRRRCAESVCLRFAGIAMLMPASFWLFPELARTLAGLANVFYALALFFLLLPVAFFQSL